ncbi:O-antigen ligase family protein [Mesorhizobium muleiense]|uniref:O-antigen ligase n=1 Tax=Mesorhizobium muleiense TaxID=1004279 RepID=A0A1G8L4H4_9HYPH|nr:O-antigen ligase family protein [Mesorhizobium muleiense]MCF6100417.1 O-antigen ligase family protein [Mesorhizobium muleiense]SDI50572.1 O-antigen ligase [Mesorhizobium muleiense]
MLLDLLLTSGLLLSAMTQLRWNGPIGPGDLLLFLWLMIMMTREVARLGPPLTPAFVRLLTFWSIIAVSLCLGAMMGYALGDLHDPKWFNHDIGAYMLVGLVSCFSVVRLQRDGGMQRLAWQFVSLGTALLAIQAALGWLNPGIAGFELWEWDRLRGLTQNSNQLAFSSAIVGLLSLHLADTAVRLLPKVGAILCLVVAVVVGGLTESNAFLLAVIVAGLCYVALKFRTWMLAEQYPLRFRSAAAWSLALILPLVLVAAVPFGASLAKHAQVIAVEATRGGAAAEEAAGLRLVVWHDALQRGLGAMMMGLGPGPHLEIPDVIVQERRLPNGGPKEVVHPEAKLAPNFEAHNIVLDLFLQGGLLALVGCIWFVAGAISAAWNARQDTIIAMICGIGAYGLFHFILRQPVLWFALVFCIVATADVGEQLVRRGNLRGAPN